jgi:hypothetical protein
MALAAGSTSLHAQGVVPTLRFTQASGCGGLFLYAWNDDRSEVLTIRADRNAVKLPDGSTTVGVTAPGVTVHVEVSGPRGNLPFCSDEQQSDTDRPVVWTAVAGKIKFTLKRRPGAFVPVSVAVDDLVIRSPDGAQAKQRRDIRFTAAIADLDQ